MNATARRRLRRIRRGYVRSVRDGGLSVFRRLRSDLVNVEVGTPRVWTDGFFGAAAPWAELAARQFVLKLYGDRLNRAMFESRGGGGAIGLAMPPAWRDLLEERGFPVRRWLSALAWQGAAFARLGHGIVQAARLCIRLWRVRPPESPGPHVTFDGLSLANLPPENGVQPNYDVCSAYARWSGHRSGLAAICHDVASVGPRDAGDLPVLYRPPAWDLAGGRAHAVRLAAWAVCAGAVAAAQMLTGRWQYAFLLAEAARARAVAMCPSEALAWEYLFHASGSVYRPLWTYEAQNRGAVVTLYFYSTYVQPKLARGYEPLAFVWGPATWQRYLVWDAWQETMLRHDLGEDIEVVHAGAIPFTDSGIPMPELPPRPVAVFGLQPFRLSNFYGITTLFDCLGAHPGYFLDFMRDVITVTAECSGTAVFKNKRYLGPYCDRRYDVLCNGEMDAGRAASVDSSIAAVRLIRGCRASVSIPFTSTALYGRELGVPSVYYDPAGWIQHDDLGAHGIPVLRGKDELRVWLGRVLASGDISP